MYTNPIYAPERYYPVTLSEIDQVTQELNIELPAFLMDFFIQYNGAGLENNFHNGQPIIGNVLILSPNMDHAEPHLSIKRWVIGNRNNDEDPVPEDILPFAIDLTGAEVYVRLNSDNLGSVYKSNWDDDNLKLLSTDFVNFINNLQAYTPPVA